MRCSCFIAAICTAANNTERHTFNSIPAVFLLPACFISICNTSQSPSVCPMAIATTAAFIPYAVWFWQSNSPQRADRTHGVKLPWEIARILLTAFLLLGGSLLLMRKKDRLLLCLHPLFSLNIAYTLAELHQPFEVSCQGAFSIYAAFLFWRYRLIPVKHAVVTSYRSLCSDLTILAACFIGSIFHLTACLFTSFRLIFPAGSSSLTGRRAINTQGENRCLQPSVCLVFSCP